MCSIGRGKSLNKRGDIEKKRYQESGSPFCLDCESRKKESAANGIVERHWLFPLEHP